MATEKNTDTNVGTGQDDKIKVVVKTQDGRERLFKMNPTTRLETLFRMFCDKMELEYRSIRFLQNGYRVSGHQLAGELELEEGEDTVEIDAMGHQTGGGLGQY